MTIEESNILPRKGSIMFDVMRGSDTDQKKALGRFKFWNKWFVIPLYQINLLPLFFIGRIFILLYTVGRKSGKTRITPLEYRKYSGDIILFSSRGERSDWYRNIKANPEMVRIKQGFRSYQPQVEFIDSLEERLEIMKWYTKKFSTASKQLFGWNKDTDSDDHLVPVAEFIQLIRLRR